MGLRVMPVHKVFKEFKALKVRQAFKDLKVNVDPRENKALLA
jgi:hypothetical protein